MKELGTLTLVSIAVSIAVFLLIVAGLIVYVAWLHYRLHREICEHRLPEVLRDSDGRPVKERL